MKRRCQRKTTALIGFAWALPLVLSAAWAFHHLHHHGEHPTENAPRVEMVFHDHEETAHHDHEHPEPEFALEPALRAPAPFVALASTASSPVPIPAPLALPSQLPRSASGVPLLSLVCVLLI